MIELIYEQDDNTNYYYTLDGHDTYRWFFTTRPYSLSRYGYPDGIHDEADAGRDTRMRIQHKGVALLL